MYLIDSTSLSESDSNSDFMIEPKEVSTNGAVGRRGFPKLGLTVVIAIVVYILK